MDGDTVGLAFGLDKQKRFLTEDEHRGLSEKMRANDRAAGRHRVGSLDDRDGVTASVCHLTGAACAFPSPQGEGRQLSDAILKSLPDLLFRQIAADEDDAAVAFFFLFPRPLVIAVQDHVHALEDEALVVILERKNALAAQDVRPFRLHQILHPGKKRVGIERLIGLERNRLHVLVVIMFETAGMGVVMVVIVVVAVVMIVMMMVVIVAIAFEKLRFDVEDAVEIEGVAAQDFVERNLSTLRLVHLGIRIDGADARLDLAQAAPARQDRSC